MLLIEAQQAHDGIVRGAFSLPTSAAGHGVIKSTPREKEIRNAAHWPVGDLSGPKRRRWLAGGSWVGAQNVLSVRQNFSYDAKRSN